MMTVVMWEWQGLPDFMQKQKDPDRLWVRILFNLNSQSYWLMFL